MIYGTGVDIVEISRFERFVRENNLSLLQRVFTPREQEYCAGKKHSAQHYALRFAAKEVFLRPSAPASELGLAGSTWKW